MEFQSVTLQSASRVLSATVVLTVSVCSTAANAFKISVDVTGVTRHTGPGNGALMATAGSGSFGASYLLSVPVSNNTGYVGLNIPALGEGFAPMFLFPDWFYWDTYYHTTTGVKADPGLRCLVQDRVNGRYYVTTTSVRSAAVGTETPQEYFYEANSLPGNLTPAFSEGDGITRGAFMFFGGTAAKSNSITVDNISFSGSDYIGFTFDCFEDGNAFAFCPSASVDSNFNFEFNINNQ